MTLTGKVFKGYAEAVVSAHGFGSNKMVKETANRIMIGLLRESESIEQDQEIGKAQDWLLANGYIRKYIHEMETSKRHRYTVTARVEYIGLTDKGWAVAEKYMKA